MKITEMIIYYLKQKWWYSILLISSTIYVLYYKYDIYQLKEFNAMNLIFILWLVLLLLPLFSELEFFGIKLKKEMEKAKAEVKENLNDLRMQIMDLKILNSNANTIYLGDSFLPTEQKLKELAGDFITTSKSTPNNLSESSPASKIDIKTDSNRKINIDFEIPEESVYLFKVRLMLEKNLTDLCEKTDYKGPKSMHEMIKHLSRCELIYGKTVYLIKQIINIANRGIHGEIVSNEYIDFIKQVLPELQIQLYEANAQLHYFTCPRCKYSNYSRLENVCPNCGFVSDDI
ncbi:MAG: TFIIB-type zinc ribbon-containing protein [Lutisporaceae bacterium]|jgi:rubrerythrin